MSDVLFDTAKFTLRPLAREKLAKVAGIVSGHPGLRLDVEGHTDSVAVMTTISAYPSSAETQFAIT